MFKAKIENLRKHMNGPNGAHYTTAKAMVEYEVMEVLFCNIFKILNQKIREMKFNCQRSLELSNSNS